MPVQRSTERFLTTHTGSLPRPSDLIRMMFAKEEGVPVEPAALEHVELPEGKVLIPGVLDSTTNFIEHPDLVAERISRYARLVGRENVIAGTDCGFGTWVGQAAVVPDIVWAKLASMADGTRRATRAFW